MKSIGDVEMKIRYGYVSNSSSNSFILTFKNNNPTIEEIENLIYNFCNIEACNNIVKNKLNIPQSDISLETRLIVDKETKLLVRECAENIKTKLVKPATKEEILAELLFLESFLMLIEGENFDERLEIKTLADKLYKQNNVRKVSKKEWKELNDKMWSIWHKEHERAKELTEFQYKWFILNDIIIPGNSFIVEYANSQMEDVLQTMSGFSYYSPQHICISKH